MFLVVLHLLMCQRKQGQNWIPKVSNAYSLVIVKRLKGIYCTTLNANMLSLVVMLSLMNPKNFNEKING
jgi:hypothetical protein